jgi:hypothetical protein
MTPVKGKNLQTGASLNFGFQLRMLPRSACDVHNTPLFNLKAGKEKVCVTTCFHTRTWEVCVTYWPQKSLRTCKTICM